MASPDEDALFAASLDEFTRRRDELARALREAGRADDAARVKALRKPSLSAWAVNQVARRHPDDIVGLFSAGDRLLEAQARALGGDASDLRETLAEQRAAVAALVERARAVLSDAGHAASQQHLERVGRTLSAAALEVETRPPVRDGRLTADLEPAGFETLVALSPEADEPPPRPAEERARAKRRKELARRAEDLAVLADEAEGRAARLAAVADDAERDARQMRADAQRAAEEARRARRAAKEAAREAEEV